jgi:hypothetical protein
MKTQTVESNVAMRRRAYGTAMEVEGDGNKGKITILVKFRWRNTGQVVFRQL